MNLKKIGNLFTSKFVGTEKRIYRTAVSQRLRNTDLGYTVVLKGYRNSVVGIMIRLWVRRSWVPVPTGAKDLPLSSTHRTAWLWVPTQHHIQ
jgi:hypothetical protein